MYIDVDVIIDMLPRFEVVTKRDRLIETLLKYNVTDRSFQGEFYFQNRSTGKKLTQTDLQSCKLDDCYVIFLS